MDHDAVLEALELATVEPDGLDRLMAGDTPAAQAVAGHLAGCPDCTLELDRLRRLGALVRETVVTTPSPDLRDRTLAYVRQHGRPRGPAVAPGQAPVALPVAVAAGSVAGSQAASRGRPVVTWVASLAAAVVLSVLATTAIVGWRLDDRLAAPGCRHRGARRRHDRHPAGDRRARRHPGRSREPVRGGGQWHARVLALDDRPGRRCRRADRAGVRHGVSVLGRRSTAIGRGSARCSSGAALPTGSVRRRRWPGSTARRRSASPSFRWRAARSPRTRS